MSCWSHIEPSTDAVVTDWPVCVSSPPAAGFTASCCRQTKRFHRADVTVTCSVACAKCRRIRTLWIFYITPLFFFEPPDGRFSECAMSIRSRASDWDLSPGYPPHLSSDITVITVRFCAPRSRHQSSDASRCCDSATELIGRLLLLLLRGEDDTVFHPELRDLSGWNLSAVSLPRTQWSELQAWKM